VTVKSGGTLVIDARELHSDAAGGTADDGPVTVEASGLLQLTGTGTAWLSGSTLVNSGTLQTSGASGDRNLVFASTTNNAGGTFDFDQAAFMSLGTFTNQGGIGVAAGKTAIALEGTTTLTGGGSFTGPGAFATNGSMVHNGGTVSPGAVLVSGGSLDASGPGAATYDIVGSASLANHVDADKHIRVLGSFDGGPSGATLTAAKALTNHGEIELSAPVSGGEAKLSTGAFTVTNNGSIHSEGDAGAARAINGSGVLTNTSTGEVDVNASTTFNAPVSNQGDFAVAATKTATIATSFNQTGGSTSVGGTLDPTGAVAIALGGGVLSGGGTVAGPLNNTGGEVRPGSSPGQLTVGGDYTQGAGATLTTEVKGTTAATGYDRLAVQSTASASRLATATRSTS
jgi:hypothetical protein